MSSYIDKNIYKEFSLDFNRINIYIDNIIISKDISHHEFYVLLEKIFNHNIDHIIDFMIVMSQSFLADFYKDKYQEICSENTHLVSDNLHELRYSTKNYTIDIKKQFMYLNIEENIYLLNYYTLLINVNLKDKTYVYHWDIL